MKRIIIIGCGFAGLFAAKKLKKSNHEIIVMDKKQTFDFLPLLPDILGNKIKPENVSYPIKKLSLKYNFNFLNEEVISIDYKNNSIATNKNSITYDYLLIAAGSETNFFNNKKIKKIAYKLDDIADAIKITKEVNNYKSILIVGGGYTGVEIATNLKVNYPDKDIIIIEKNSVILQALPASMQEYVINNLKKLNINVITNSAIENIDTKDSMIIWAPGVKPPAFTGGKRININEYLQFNNNCFVAGDSANFIYKNAPLRMAVQFSIMQGKLAAKNILSLIQNQPLDKYLPIDLGYVVPMANKKGCGKVLGLEVKGITPIFLHYFMSVYRSYGFKNKLAILFSLLRRICQS